MQPNSKPKIEWEEIDVGLVRSRVPGGWLVKCYEQVAHIGSDKNEYITTGYDWRVALTFVPDPSDQWLNPGPDFALYCGDCHH